MGPLGNYSILVFSRVLRPHNYSFSSIWKWVKQEALKINFAKTKPWQRKPEINHRKHFNNGTQGITLMHIQFIRLTRFSTSNLGFPLLYHRDRVSETRDNLLLSAISGDWNGNMVVVIYTNFPRVGDRWHKIAKTVTQSVTYQTLLKLYSTRISRSLS